MVSLTDDNIKALIPYFGHQDTVIVAPLHWGLGHATRCIPIIYWLKSICKKVIIASDGPALDVLRKEFPELTYYELPSYHIRYKYSSIFWNIVFGLPQILIAMYQERNAAERIAKEDHATIILSDNRLGFRSHSCTNIYLTHQVNILHRRKLIASLGTWMHRYIYKKFDTVFIPDFNGAAALCPLLSHTDLKKAIYIGPLTRIKKLDLDKTVDILVILSGPEPQRTMLESALLKELNILVSYKITFVRGTESKLGARDAIKKHIEILNVLQGEEIERLLNSSKLLIARSGYSTIMDVTELNIPTIWIPTPGQTEQEYLAEINRNKVFQYKLNQNEVNKLQKIIISMI
jgi:UDP:flavonoid glycosyltransferase YjiC (YdhE family)